MASRTIKQQKNKHISNNETILKFQELKTSKTYVVKEISQAIKTKFGVSYILTLQENCSKNVLKVWSTKSLVYYIENEQPTKKWKFCVMVSNDMKYPEIEGYTRYKVTRYCDSDSEGDSQ
jgi:hypothetical protein